VTLGEFASVVHGQIAGVAPSQPLLGFALDNREVKPGDVFVAIKGANVDGHDFVSQAFSGGAVAALVERQVDVPHILVPNVVQALADFAAHIRSGFDGPVVAVTGSAGKTTTKELIAAALSPLGPVLKTQGNRNSEFSSPLLWLELDPSHKSVVVEMGMRGFGQVAHLASFTKPTIGVVTNIGVSHMELVGSREGIARAKGEVLEALPSDGAAVIWAEDPYCDLLRKLSKAKVWTFGFSQSADCRIIGYNPLDWRSCRIEGKVHDVPYHAKLPAVGRHIALNAAAAIMVAASAGVNPADAADALSTAEFPPMRMEIVEHGGVTFVVDAYNASPPSVIAALQTLAEMPVKGRRIAVLGEMKELGNYAEQGHREVGSALVQAEVDEVLLIGEATRWIGSAAQNTGLPASSLRYVDDVGQISDYLQSLVAGDTVLIKGSRALGLERSLDFLKEPVS
jgi:UDP-N-acetylmuramoyl-tripeptide--D-alanyl-D-alanine ligase